MIGYALIDYLFVGDVSLGLLGVRIVELRWRWSGNTWSATEH